MLKRGTLSFLAYTNGSLNVFAEERNHIVEGFMVSTFGSRPCLVKLPQGNPPLFFTPFCEQIGQKLNNVISAITKD